MKIEDFCISMQSEHSKSKKVSHIFEQELISLEANKDVQSSDSSKEIDVTGNELAFAQRLEYMLVQEFIYSLQNINIRSNNQNNFRFRSLDNMNIEPRKLSAREVTLSEEIVCHEKLDVSMQGCIQTATQKIKLDIDVSFSSTYVERNQLTKSMFYDPLVLNFDGELPSLDSQKFSFDIDCDGESDQISVLSEGCGFLALDKNNNNSIDDGTELFGTQNGNGFYDLARYDDDNNGWIDENDSILDSLRIWRKTDTEDELIGLGEIGIGAIYLGYNEESFDLKTSNNEILGRIKSNGLFLNENGSSGIVSQIDFAKKDSKLSELIQSA
ncbi:hypothetical protein FJR48_07220 [Sulfurimonas lithotrophica]|uniref:VCBS repeat-containing protein n=1 Tax=Sulfurimonas lithotrophica TaxID=2590022 RepID=A0A5P8P1I4_9BACT|nr:hypothetical protein [Sulfurimonas lithotrophica]QFR49534.1 hypothetical protein FJR48_07220 [Sulfurimonas lithotrophica]